MDIATNPRRYNAMDEYIAELKQAIKADDTAQAKSLLSGIASRHDTEKQEVFQQLALAGDKTALELLHFMTDRNQTPDPEMLDRLFQLIIDRAHLNQRFVLILFHNAPKHLLNSVIPLLKHTLTSATDHYLLSQVLNAAGKFQIESLAGDIAEFIFYDDPVLKKEAVKALERIGTPGACRKLEQAADTEKCDQDILDAIDALKTRRTEEPESPDPEDPPASIPAGDECTAAYCQLSSPDLMKRFEALILLSDDSRGVAEALSANIDSSDHDLLINLIRLAARTLPIEAVNDLLDIASSKKSDPVLKFCAYDALSCYPELESAAAVIQGVSETAMYVRMAAVQALDKNLTDFVRAEIKNRIESGTKKGEQLAQCILDVQARHLIEFLMISDTFSYMASNYLSRKAPEAVIDTFIDILEKRKLKSTAKKYQAMKTDIPHQEQKKFIIVSASQCTRNFLSSHIFNAGFPSQAFSAGQKAFESLMEEEPAAILCDLFLNNMTGMDFAREVREIYPKEMVPVIVSSRQKTLNMEKLKTEMASSGVNVLCDFPPKISQIKSWARQNA